MMREFMQVYKSILLADDDADDRDLFSEAIHFIDPTIRVTLRRDGEELMHHLVADSAEFDLIFLDLNMPRKNGKECLAEIKSNRRLAKTPVIVYTTSLNPVDIDETFALGASFFLRKPNSFEDLKDILGIVLSARLPEQETRKEQFVINNAFNRR